MAVFNTRQVYLSITHLIIKSFQQLHVILNRFSFIEIINNNEATSQQLKTQQINQANPYDSILLTNTIFAKVKIKDQQKYGP
jgi:hypothetical protein